MTYVDMFAVLSKPWASAKDIMIIGSCGRDKASDIRDQISDEIKKRGNHLPITKEKIVPMDWVIKYFNLDIEYITLMAQKEKIINS